MAQEGKGNDRLIISMCGGAGLFPVLMGQASELMLLIRKWAPEREIFTAGVSAGCLPALMLALGYTTPEQMTALFLDFSKRFDTSKSTKPSTADLFAKWKQYLLDLLEPGERWRTLSGRLFIGVSVWNAKTKELEPRVISQFESAEAVCEAVLTSAHLFILGLWPTRSFKGQYAADGGFTMRYVELPRKYGITLPVCYDAISEHIDQLDYSVDFAVDKYIELFRLGRRIVRKQQDYYLTLMWFGPAGVKNMPAPHHDRPFIPKLDAVSISLLAGIGVTLGTGALWLTGSSLRQLGSATGNLLYQLAMGQKNALEQLRPMNQSPRPLHNLVRYSM